MSHRHATLHQLQTTLGGRDLYDMIEVIYVDALNKLQAEKDADRERD